MQKYTETKHNAACPFLSKKKQAKSLRIKSLFRIIFICYEVNRSNQPSLSVNASQSLIYLFNIYLQQIDSISRLVLMYYLFLSV